MPSPPAHPVDTSLLVLDLDVGLRDSSFCSSVGHSFLLFVVWRQVGSASENAQLLALTASTTWGVCEDLEKHDEGRVIEDEMFPGGSFAKGGQSPVAVTLRSSDAAVTPAPEGSPHPAQLTGRCICKTLE